MHQAAAEYFVALGVRGASLRCDKNRVDLKVGLVQPDGRVHLGAVLQQKQITQERARSGAKALFAVGFPDILSATYRFLDAVIGVVAE